MIPREIRRYRESCFPLLSTFVGDGPTTQSGPVSGLPRLPGTGGQLGTRLPQIGNKVSLIAMSQEERNIDINKSRTCAKYTKDTRRERAPDRNHTNKGKRSHGTVDSDLCCKSGPVCGQNSKPLSKQKNRRKHGHKCKTSSPYTIDESERSSLNSLQDKNRKHYVLKRRHKSHVRESPYSVNTAEKVSQRRRIKSCDRSSVKDTKSLSDVKDELLRQKEDIKLTGTEISVKQEQRVTSSPSNAKKETAPNASKPPTQKRWKCIMVKHSRKSTPMWVGNLPAESWEEECKNANNLKMRLKVPNKEFITKENSSTKKSEGKEKEATGALKNGRSFKAMCPTIQMKKRGSLVTNMNGEKAVKEKENSQIRRKKQTHEEEKLDKHEPGQKKKSGSTRNTETSADHKSSTIAKRSELPKRNKPAKATLKKDSIPKNIIPKRDETSETKPGQSKDSRTKTSMNGTEKLQRSINTVKKAKEKAKNSVIDHDITINKNKMLKSKTGDTYEKNIGKDKHKLEHGNKSRIGQNGKDFTHKLDYHKSDKETSHKDKKVYMRKTDKYDFVSINKNRYRNKEKSLEETKERQKVKTDNLNKSSPKASMPAKLKLTNSGRAAKLKPVNDKPDHTPINKTLKTTKLTSQSSHAAAFPPSSRATISKTLVSSASTAKTKRSISSASSEGSVAKQTIQSTKSEVLRKSPGSEKTDLSEQRKRDTLVSKRSTRSRSSTSVSRSSISPASGRSSSSRNSALKSERSVTTKTVASSGRYDSGSLNTMLSTRSLSSRNTTTPVSERTHSKHSLNAPHEKAFSRTDSHRPLSTKSAGRVSRIPVATKSTSSVPGRTTSKSAMAYGRAADVNPILKSTTSTQSSNNVPRSTSAKVKSASPAFRVDMPQSLRSQSRNEANTSSGRKSALPVLVRSAGSSLPSSKTRLSSAPSRSCASSRSSASSIGYKSDKCEKSPINLCMSKASNITLNGSVCSYDDDFEYESDASYYSKGSSRNT